MDVKRRKNEEITKEELKTDLHLLLDESHSIRCDVSPIDLKWRKTLPGVRKRICTSCSDRVMRKSDVN